MSDLKGTRHRTQTKKFLEDACTLIELSNIVEGFRLGHINICEPCICNNEVDTCNKIRREPKKADRDSDDDPFVKWPKSEVRHSVTNQAKPTLDNSHAAKSKRKTTVPKRLNFDLKELSKCKLKDFKHLNRQSKEPARHRQSLQLQPSSKKERNVSTKAKERLMKIQPLASNLDMIKYMNLCLLKKKTKHNTTRKSSIVLLTNKDFSKSSLNAWKSFSSLSDTYLFNKTMKQSTNKRDVAFNGQPTCKRGLKTLVDTKPSIQLNMNLRLKPNSNTMNLQMKSRQGKSNSRKSNLDTIAFCLPFECNSSVHQGIISKKTDKLSISFSSSVLTERSVTTPSAQTSNDRQFEFLKPYGKTHVVYNLYDVAQPVGQMRGIRSHISFNVNFGRPPDPPREVYPLTAPPSGRLADRRQVLYNSKVNFNSGSTSMQQSFALGRSPQSISPYGSDHYDPSVRSSGLESEPAVCQTCCGGNRFQQTKQRIIDRVEHDDGTSWYFSPNNIFKKCYEKYKTVQNKDEEQTRSVGSCTCSPFIETEQFSVQEGNVDPSCSFLQRCFGKIIFSNKCIVCTEEKKVGTKYRPLKSFECAPGTCEIIKPGILDCFKKWCKKKSEERAAKAKEKMKAKEKEKKEKAKALEKQKKAKAKEKKMEERKQLKAKRDREKGTSSKVTSIFKNPEEDDDRQKLLSDKAKRSRKNGDDSGKGKEGETSEFENKAKKGLATTRRGYRRVTRRIRERYYRNKKLAEEQKGQYACDFYLMSLRSKPCLWVYYLCPVCYPYVLQALNLWRQVSDLLLFFVAIVVWSPCILCTECLKVVACNMCVS